MRDATSDSLEPLYIGLLMLALFVGSAWVTLAGLGWLGMVAVSWLSLPETALDLFGDKTVPGLLEAGMSVILLSTVAGIVGMCAWNVAQSMQHLVNGLYSLRRFRTIAAVARSARVD